VFKSLSLSRSLVRRALAVALLAMSLPSSAGPTYDLCVMFFTRDYRDVAKDMCLQCKYQKYTGQPVDPDCADAPAADKAGAAKPSGGNDPKAADKPAAGK
jgi:hypothetical protein